MKADGKRGKGRRNAAPAGSEPAAQPDAPQPEEAAGSWFVLRPGLLELKVRVVPRASRERIAGLLGDRVKVQIHAPPVEGEANRALTVLLAAVAGLPASSVSVVAGAKDRSKTVVLQCGDSDAVLERLRNAIAAAAPKGGGDPAPSRPSR